MKTKFDPQCITYSQMNLIFNSRIYYRRLATWTRTYIFSKFYGIGEEDPQFEHLYFESLDIGDMLQIIFGRIYSERYSQLVSQFPIAYRDLLTAQLEGNTEAVNNSVNRLYANVNDRAAYLAELNPYWSEAQYQEMFGTYIRLILETTNAIISGDIKKNIELYDQLTDHTNRMGDVFAEGIYDYMTSGLQNSETTQSGTTEFCMTAEQVNTIYQIRTFWFELVTWIRNYMLSRYREIGNPEEVFARLQRVISDYTNALKVIFNEEVAADLQQELSMYLDLIDAYITAQMAGNTSELDRITRLLYQNADDRAASISSANPFWSENEWRNRLYNNLRSTIEESTTFLTGDYARNIDIYSRLIDLSEDTSTYFAKGLLQYLNTNQQNQ